MVPFEYDPVLYIWFYDSKKACRSNRPCCNTQLSLKSRIMQQHHTDLGVIPVAPLVRSPVILRGKSDNGSYHLLGYLVGFC